MSLALAAKHLESQGRGKDTHLVHMTPNELKALNKLSTYPQKTDIDSSLFLIYYYSMRYLYLSREIKILSELSDLIN